MKLSTSDRKRLATLIRRIEKEKKVIAKSRDALRDLIGDVESIIDSADSAVYDLESAADSLSQYL